MIIQFKVKLAISRNFYVYLNDSSIYSPHIDFILDFKPSGKTYNIKYKCNILVTYEATKKDIFCQYRVLIAVIFQKALT